ncbi:HYR domain-containing protein [Lacinutrix jangbogonensis]|uniref:HYR domain-containing protein n=1 Tax=Lacinutrix jangbogonensis TaxID=1469557 RepID=UPI00053F2766|nr:HYR domain-containing protein [Lacinutrix jangbogonensis]
MKKITLSFLLSIFSFAIIFAQGIFDDAIHTAVNFGSVNSPGAEGVQNIIDQNSATKFLDFNAGDGIGFDVDLLGVSHIAIAMEIVTANDAPERDPTAYEILGSNDGNAYTSVATGTIPCVSTRLFNRTYSFASTTAYTFYRVNFTGTCGTSTINQIADVQLYSAIGDTPVFTCPGDITVDNTAGQCDGVATYTITVSDTEDGSLTPTLITGQPSAGSFPIGTTIVSYTVTDSDNNTVSCSFNVTVNDTENPVVNCPANIMADTNPGDPTTVVTYAVIGSDNCSAINPLAGFSPLGTINGQAYYLSDASLSPAGAFTEAGNQGGFIGTIRNAADGTYLLDAIKKAGFLGDILLGYNDTASEGSFVWHTSDPATYNNWNPGEPNNSGNEDYTVMQSSGGWNDVNDIASYRYLLEIPYSPEQTAGLASGSDFPIGVTTNTFVVTDVTGNSETCSFTVTVNEVLSVDSFSLETSISMLPNPVKNNLFISNSSNIKLETALVFDINGRLVKSFNLNEVNETVRLEISALKSGLYLINITNQQGHSIIKKFIKE